MDIESGTLASFRDASRLSRLMGAVDGSDPFQQAALTKRFKALVAAHGGRDNQKSVLLFVPGRIEVLGKHTDYAGGVSLTCASQHGMAAIAASHHQASLIVTDVARGVSITIAYSDPRPVAGHSWSRYVARVLARMIRHFGVPRSGVHIVLGSDLPSASGMSSSSALIITTMASLMGVADFDVHFDFSTERLAGFGGAVESGAAFENLPGDNGVGTRGGSQDHTAILCSTKGHLGLYSYYPVKRESLVRLPDDVHFVVASSGVKARKTGKEMARYNLLSARAGRVVQMWNEKEGARYRTMGEMVSNSGFSRDLLRSLLSLDPDYSALWNRFLQFDRECSIVIPSAILALEEQNWNSFGHMVDESQRMSDEWLGNQVAETRDLARLARSLGAYAASAFGAGFGGAVWALVPVPDSREFSASWMKAYLDRYPSRITSARFFPDAPSRGVFSIGSDRLPF